MNNDDLAILAEMFDGLCEMYGKAPLSPVSLGMYSACLTDYSITDIGQAINKHLTCSKHGSFFPKIADITRHLDGGEITADMVIASAKLAKTPLGCLARIKIGTWDLSGGDPFYLKQRATECLLELPEWKSRASRGDYSNHEISVMLKYGVSPSAPFANGLASPPANSGLIERSREIESSSRHQRFIEAPFEPDTESTPEIHPAVSAYLDKLT